MAGVNELTLAQLDWGKTQQLLAQGACLVTANQRQAQVLLLRYAESKQSSSTAWLKPKIIAWHQWQQQVFNEVASRYAQPVVLLEEYQSEWLWQQAINLDNHSDVLLNRNACAQSARAAWQLSQAFDLDEQALEAYPSAETSAFLRWAKHYAVRLEKLQAIDHAQLTRRLLDTLNQQLWQPPQHWIAYGFERWLPAQQNLLSALLEKNTQLHELVLPAETQSQRVVVAADETQELIHAAYWAKQQLKLNKATVNSKPIAIVMPDLHLRRAEVESILTAVLHPDWDVTQQVELDQQRLFDISAAVPLADAPLMVLAFGWLSLLQGRVRFAVLSRILRSPLLATEESQARAQLEIQLRSQGLEQFDLTAVMHLAGQLEQPWHCPLLLRDLRSILESKTWFAERQSSSAWVQQITQLLITLDWPLANVEQSSVQSPMQQDFHLRASWQQLLQQFRRLTIRDERLSGSQVLQWLQHLARAIPLQRARPYSHVQVLGLLEALGQRYSAVWVTGMSASNWPAAAQPNPFLPVALQRRYAMPQASAEQELQYAQHATQSLLAMAAEVVFSYPQIAQDAAQLSSPLVHHLAELEQLSEIDKYPHWQRSWQQRQLQSYQDTQALSTAYSQSDVLYQSMLNTDGGSGLLKAQAQCPFQAVGQYRLTAQALDHIQPGISALQHGNCIHAVLQCFWQGYSYQRLTDVTAREQKLDQCIQRYLSHHSIACLNNKQLRQAYAGYLQAILSAWLALEAQRTTAFKVVALEQKKQLQLGQLNLKVRIDRVDELADGSLLVIDYKSGTGNPNSWCDERLSEPQLPLYALHTQPLGGVVFANLKPGQARYQGFTLDAEQLPQVAQLGAGTGALHKNYKDWSALQSDWQNRLTQLADEYYLGKAQVDPYQNACRFCRRQSLCRVDALQSGM